MRWLSYIFPQRIAEFSSPYNKEIRINEERGKLKLLVNGSRQSGEYVEMLWKEACKAFGLPQRPFRILVLGVGGGTVIWLLRSYYPEADIVGVDIDQTMIDIGKRYFGLDTVEKLTFICDDAEMFVAKERSKFDLVIVDLFIGTQVPKLVRKESFLKTLKRILTKNGVVIINYLREFDYLKKSEQLKRTLSKIFPYVAETSIYNNRFFLGRMIK